MLLQWINTVRMLIYNNCVHIMKFRVKCTGNFKNRFGLAMRGEYNCALMEHDQTSN